MDAKTDRERRLAEQLRANLRRRKAQARETEARDTHAVEGGDKGEGEAEKA